MMEENCFGWVVEMEVEDEHATVSGIYFFFNMEFLMQGQFTFMPPHFQ